MKTALRVICLTLMLLSFTLAYPHQETQAQGPIQLKLTSLPVTPAPSEIFFMTGIEIHNLQRHQVYGGQFYIHFDPLILQVVDTDPHTPGVQIQIPEGTYFEGRDHMVANNQVDNANGVIRLAVSLHAPAAPINEDALLALITWKYVGTGEDLVTWNTSHTKLVDRNGINLPYTPHNIKLGYPAPPAYTGQVLLQGRTRHQGSLVILAMEPCLPSFPTQVSAQMAEVSPENIIPDMPYAFTDQRGNFSLTPYTNQEPHYRCLMVFHQGYLTGQKTIPRGGAPAGRRYTGEITLLGGDVNEDDVINIFDLVKIAYHMGPGRYDRAADINADGRVDISDLTIAANNFGLRGPQSNWKGGDF